MALQSEKRWGPILYMISGVALFIPATFMLLRHQYVYFSHFLTIEYYPWNPTIVLLLLGVWLFILGLVGFIRARNNG